MTAGSCSAGSQYRRPPVSRAWARHAIAKPISVLVPPATRTASSVATSTTGCHQGWNRNRTRGSSSPRCTPRPCITTSVTGCPRSTSSLASITRWRSAPPRSTPLLTMTIVGRVPARAASPSRRRRRAFRRVGCSRSRASEPAENTRPGPPLPSTPRTSTCAARRRSSFHTARGSSAGTAAARRTWGSGSSTRRSDHPAVRAAFCHAAPSPSMKISSSNGPSASQASRETSSAPPRKYPTSCGGCS